MFELVKKYNMDPHEENGSFLECHYDYEGEGRAPSGSSYFYVNPGESTLFHTIDCDEYWCYNQGSNLEVWIINVNGELEIKKLGIGPDAEPLIYFPKGVIFGSRSLEKEGPGTFFTCITVPRFQYSGFKLVEESEIIKLCPEAAGFFEIP